MVIFICGQVGAGKTALARALSQKLNIAYCDADLIKKHFVYQQHLGVATAPLSDEARQDVSYSIARHLERLSTKHRHVVVDDTLHRRKPRNILFDAATAFLGGYRIVRVHASERVVTDRLSGMRRDHLLTSKNEKDIRAAIVDGIQDFDEPVLELDNSGSIEISIERLVALVSAELNDSQRVT